MVDSFSESIERPRHRLRRLFLLSVPFYCLLSLVSLSRFLYQPDSRIFGTAWNALFQIFAPSIGSFVITIVLASETFSRRIRIATGMGLILLVLIVSAICMYWSFPVLMSV